MSFLSQTRTDDGGVSTPARIRAELVSEPSKPAIEAQASLLRDFVFEALAPVEHDSASARSCLQSDDDTGTRYHLKRVVECVKAAAKTFREVEALSGRAA
jgi:hypothetical protein